MKNKIKRLTELCLILMVLCVSNIAFCIDNPEKYSDNDIISILQTNFTEKNITYTIQPIGVVMSVPISTFFADGNENIRGQATNFLDRIGNILKILDMECLIESNTKNMLYDKSKYQSNIEYSTILAEKILKYLLEHTKINQQKIRAIGFGEFSPFADKNFQNDKENRIDFIILNYKDSIYFSR